MIDLEISQIHLAPSRSRAPEMPIASPRIPLAQQGIRQNRGSMVQANSTLLRIRRIRLRWRMRFGMLMASTLSTPIPGQTRTAHSSMTADLESTGVLTTAWTARCRHWRHSKEIRPSRHRGIWMNCQTAPSTTRRVKPAGCAVQLTGSVAGCWSSQGRLSRTNSMRCINTLRISALDRARWLSTAGTDAIHLPMSF
jgi:hypothetical protein